MAPPEQYTLDEFVKFAQTNFPVEYTSIADLDIYRFEEQTCVNLNEEARSATLLHVGRYHYSTGDAPVAWAYVTSEGITYYSGHPGRVCKRIPAKLAARIYHDYPFDLMFAAEGTQRTSHRSDPTQVVKESVIESVINFSYLVTGRLQHIDNEKARDILGDFKFACLTFHRARGLRVKAEHTQLEQSLDVTRASEIRTAQRHSSQFSADGRVRIDSGPNGVLSANSAGMDDEVMRIGSDLRSSQIHTSLLDYLSNYEASIRSEQAKELEALRAKVAAKTSRIQSVRTKLEGEKAKRRALQAELESERAERHAIELQLGDTEAKHGIIKTELKDETACREIAEKQLHVAREELEELMTRDVAQQHVRNDALQRELSLKKEVAGLQVSYQALLQGKSWAETRLARRRAGQRAKNKARRDRKSAQQQ